MSPIKTLSDQKLADRSAIDDYYLQAKKLTEAELHALLDAGNRWRFADTLLQGGSALFPHAYLPQCGEQIASVVMNCLDTGADQFLILGVLHPFLRQELLDAYCMERQGLNMMHTNCRGIFGPGNPGDYWQQEYSLFNFKLLWDTEIIRRGIRSPKLIFRYPFLVGQNPETLSGIKEMKALAKDSILVMTGDLCHRGEAYKAGTGMEMGKEAISYAKKTIKRGLDLLQMGDAEKFYQHCVDSKSDFYNVGTLFRYLKGPKKAELLDLKLVNVDPLYPNTIGPNWVATSLCLFENLS